MESPPVPEDPDLITHSSSTLLLNYASLSDMSVVSLTLFTLLVLLILSAFFSAAENAFFSLSNADLQLLEKKKPRLYDTIAALLVKPRILLATILIGNNLINVAFILIASWFLDSHILEDNQLPLWVDFVAKVVSVTFVLLVLGEVIPKTYATKQNKKIALFLAIPLKRFQQIFSFLIFPLANSASWLDKKVKTIENKLSADQLSRAIDITNEQDSDYDEKFILKGIVNFGNTEVRQIMKPRVDVAAIDIDATFSELMDSIQKNGYSRMPVFKEMFDHIEGIIYIKDVLPFIQQSPDFKWQKLIKPAFFVPENKKIDDLLREFQEKRVHMALVVDEFGGKQGIITLEDILEEIFGEINDEFDEADAQYVKLNDTTYSMDAKVQLKDFCKWMQTEVQYFEEIGEEVETLAGLVMELAGRIPNRGDAVQFRNFIFTVEVSDKRRIKRIKVEKNIE